MPESRSGQQDDPLPPRKANFPATSSHSIGSEESDLLPPPEPERVPPLLRNRPRARKTEEAGESPRFVGYEILGELGRGGMGIVYKAHNRRRNQVVALKTLPGIDPEALYRFKQEFRTLADVTHPNLVTLYELISDGNQWFFTMEFVPGVDFLTYVGCGGYLLEETTADYGAPAFPLLPRPPSGGGEEKEIQRSVLTSRQISRLRAGLRQLVQGVVALHDAGKLHRDIKPRNVLVTPQERVVLLDFGFATQLDETGLHQSTEHIVGTAAYMAPEQAAGKPVSAATDWYSVGVILYEALTGQLPFRGSSWQILKAKRDQDPPPPAAVAPGVPEDLNALCVELLRRDAAARPTREELLRRLGPPTPLSPAGGEEERWRLAPPTTTRQGVGLVGREWHLAVLTEVYQNVKQGRTRILCVHGSSGMGKTALVQHFLDELVDRREAVVLAGRCYEQESVPYKALDSLVDALSQYLRRLPAPAAHALMPRDVLALARVFPVLRQVEAVANAPHRDLTTTDGQELRRRAFAALRELLARLGDRVPLVLFIDDLQWGDVDSAAMLAELLRPPDPPVLLLLACYRSEDVRRSRCLQALVQASTKDSAVLERRELAVEALAPPDARDLAAALLDNGNPLTLSWAEAIARESGGNPFFVFQLAQSVNDQAASRNPGTGEEMPSLDKVLWARITRLPEAARRLLEVMAVAGAPLRRADARPASDLGDQEQEALVVLRSGRLIRTTGLTEQEEIETYHDRIRETIVARLPPAKLQGHHGRLALTLQASGQADPEVLAVHFAGAGDTPQAGRYYALAAHQASEALAFDRAAKLYRLALELGPADEASRSNLCTKLGDALANAGRGAEAAREYLAAAPLVDAAARLDLQRRAAYQYLISGHFDAGLATMAEVLRGVGLKLPATPRRALLSLLLRRCWLRVRGLRCRERGRDPAQVRQADLARLDTYWSAATGMALIDIIRAADLQVRGLLLALRVGDPIRVTRALALEAIYSAADGERSHNHTAKLLREAESQKMEHPYTRGVIRMAQGAVSFLEGHFQPALPPLVEAEEVFRDCCTGVAWELDLARFYQLMSLLYQGKVVDLARRAPVLLKQAQERSDLFAATNLNTYFIPFILLAADDPEQARRTVRQALGLWSQRGFHTQHAFALVSEIQIDLYQGAGWVAWQRLKAQWPAYAGSLLKRIEHSRIVMSYARARSALAAAAEVADPRPLWQAAEGDACRLERESRQRPLFPTWRHAKMGAGANVGGAAWSIGLAGLIRAGLAMTRGDAGNSRAQLLEALIHLDGVGTDLHAAAARRRLGGLVGGQEGRAYIEQAEAWMASQGIVNPRRMTAALIPGFPKD